MKNSQFQTTWGKISIKVIVASILNALSIDWRYVQYRRWTPDRKWSHRYRPQNDTEENNTDRIISLWLSLRKHRKYLCSEKKLHLRHLVTEPFAFDNKNYLRYGTENPHGRNINDKRGETLTFSPNRKTTKTRELFTFCFPECWLSSLPTIFYRMNTTKFTLGIESISK